MLQSVSLEATQMVTGSQTGSHRVTQGHTDGQRVATSKDGPHTAGGASVRTDPATNSSRNTAGF